GFKDDESANDGIISVLNYYDTIINSVKSFDPNITIGLAVTIPPNYSQTSFGKQYGNIQTRWRYKRNNFLFTKELIKKYKDRELENIYLIPINVNIDTVNNFEFEETQVNKRNPKT